MDDQTQPRPTSQFPNIDGGKIKSNTVEIPSISLPKGGGAIRGIGEKFAANPVTGTGSMTVPIAVSPGRSGFGPQLSLSYDSGLGNGPFGIGWNLSLPSITRKTDKGLPLYREIEESDVFILSGAEDLVPVVPQPSIPSVSGYTIKHYRPRIEGLFARIERWTNETTKEIHWRSISRDNITTLYGKDHNSRIFDPAEIDSGSTHPIRIFNWLVCESFDDKGNAIVYEYAAENSKGVDQSQASERNRICNANRYLKRILYGNRTSRLRATDYAADPGWMFEVVFDYGEHNAETPMPGDSGDWLCRHDPFSSYRSGFEVRTYRLCQRVLMFHHIPDLLTGEKGYDGLVRSTDFIYRNLRKNRDDFKKGHPIGSFINSVTQSGYKYDKDNKKYLKKSLPPVEFAYTDAEIDETIREIDPASLENLPVGLDGSQYQWVDLDGEGLSGILTEQGGSWFYKRNLSANNHVTEHGADRTAPMFGPLELVAARPNAALSSGAFQFMDLAGTGQLDLVAFRGVVPGFYERTEDQDWEQFRSFTSLPNVSWNDPNLKFVDLNGDGHADILITEDDALTWYPSYAEQGFGPAQRVSTLHDEETGPRLIFADGTQSIYLADLSGDGLTDLARIRNGEVCYWPNLGYGKFGAKVTMDNSPWFDNPDLFDQRRIRLADIDGSGTTDIIYLSGNGAAIYHNESGNGWSDPEYLKSFPPIDDFSSVVAIDLFGNGTACLVWSSSLPGNGRSPMRYIDLMGGQKPHLLVKTINNLGAETEVQYAPSTKFYLQDKQDGKPWITKLPFPVHCVEKVKVTDKWRNTEFSTRYSYHHGYFDGAEREFRGFGRVEQVDVESFDKFATGNINSPFITDDYKLYQPPVKTVTWYHTGAFIDRQKIWSHFSDEYFHPFNEYQLSEPNLEGANLTTEEWREALRACKGMMLRQEVYELEVDAEKDHQDIPVRLFTTAFHTCDIRMLQSMAVNRHAVFHVTESEAITYHYELDLRKSTAIPDPRIAHSLNLKIDEFGNLQQSVAVVYPRQGKFGDGEADLAEGLTHALPLIDSVQTETHLAYTETRYTDDFGSRPEDAQLVRDNHRLRVPCEVLTYELTGILLAKGVYFDLAELRSYCLSDTLPDQGSKPVGKLEYHEIPDGKTPQKRLVEHARTLYFADAPTETSNFLKKPLQLGEIGRLGLLYEQYKLALTDTLLTDIFADKLTPDIQGTMSDSKICGYLSSTDPDASRVGIATGQYWIRSGIAGFAPDADLHFYLPERYTDPFGNETQLTFDDDDLFIKSSKDPAGNVVSVEQFDFRVLAPCKMKDINDNFSAVVFDIMGMPVASANMGKEQTESGDNLGGIELDVPIDEVEDFFITEYDEAIPRSWLGNATARFVYDFGIHVAVDGTINYAERPASACGIVRETHVKAGGETKIQVAVEYSDGMGTVLVKKAQAEPDPASTLSDPPLRWIANGKTILNNKGKPVKQYEPYFSANEHRFDKTEAQSEVGVTPIMYYDAAGRLIRTEQPDGSYSRVGFSPWHTASFDPNDTVLEPDNPWYARMTSGTATTEEQRAAALAAVHSNTPAITILDSLGRDVITIAHNRIEDAAGAVSINGQTYRDEKYLTFSMLDAEGKPLWIKDARGNIVMRYTLPCTSASDPLVEFYPAYDIAGNLLFQHSMDAGDRWMLNDAAGKPMLAWDVFKRQETSTVEEKRLYSTEYDALHRPTALKLKINNATPVMVERFEYQDAQTNPGNNLNGQLVRHYDPSGCLETIRRDFQGNVLEIRRTLTKARDQSVIDWQNETQSNLETDANGEPVTYTQITEYDALNRMTRLYNWHRPTGNRIAIYEPQYNERGALHSEDLVMHATGYDPKTGTRTTAIREVCYNARGQKEFLKLGKGTLTQYEYDDKTFRLKQLRTTRPPDSGDFPGRRSNLSNPSIVQQLLYTYDPMGNITEIEDQAYKPVFFSNALIEPKNLYKYDSLYRLIEATGRENGALVGAPVHFDGNAPVAGFPNTDPNALCKYTQTYSYDAVGNILRMHHEAGPGPTGIWTRNYSYAGDSNRLLQTWQGSDTIHAVNYLYDTHGNMLNLENVAPGQHLVWDHRDMIASLDLVGGGFAYYQYDSGKQRTRKYIERKGADVEERIYLGGYELFRRTVSGSVVEEIESHHLFEGQQRVLLVDDVLIASDSSHPRFDSLTVKAQTLFRYQYSNHLGSVCLELDDQAGIISYEEYHPYGTSAYRVSKSGVEAPPKRYRYTGMERDEESGLNYHGARYYAPWLGRWVSCDPVGVSHSANVYEYSRNNPVIYSDDDGRQPKTQVQLHLNKMADVIRTIQAAVPKSAERDMREKLIINAFLAPLGNLSYKSPDDPKQKDQIYVRRSANNSQYNPDQTPAENQTGKSIAEQPFIYNETRYANYCNIFVYNIAAASGAQMPFKDLLGGGQDIYAAFDFKYIFQPEHEYFKKRGYTEKDVNAMNGSLTPVDPADLKPGDIFSSGGHMGIVTQVSGTPGYDEFHVEAIAASASGKVFNYTLDPYDANHMSYYHLLTEVEQTPVERKLDKLIHEAIGEEGSVTVENIGRLKKQAFGETLAESVDNVLSSEALKQLVKEDINHIFAP